MSIKQKRPLTISLFILSAVMMLSFLPQQADARRGGGGGARMHSSVHRSSHVNRSRNVNVNRNVNIDIDHRRGGFYHPVAAGVAIGATVAVTAAVVGSVYHTLPTGCSTVINNGITYSQCGSVWYQPRYSGSNVTYVVVNPM